MQAEPGGLHGRGRRPRRRGIRDRSTPGEFCAMCPSVDGDESRRCAVEELTSDEAHPEPKPLVWLAQMVVDGDIPRRRKDGGNHLGLDADHIDRTYQHSPRTPSRKRRTMSEDEGAREHAAHAEHQAHQRSAPSRE